MNPTLTIAGVMMLAAALLLSCGGDAGSQAGDHDDGGPGQSSPSATVVPDDGLDGIEMNDGRKWEVDDHTRSSFAKMSASFSGLDYPALEGDALKKAGSDLLVDLDQLIMGCTMSGKAHDQLHVFLTGYMPAVAELSESGEVEDAGKVKHYLEKYGDFFD